MVNLSRTHQRADHMARDYEVVQLGAKKNMTNRIETVKGAGGLQPSRPVWSGGRPGGMGRVRRS